jgi:hypothetical protein
MASRTHQSPQNNPKHTNSSTPSQQTMTPPLQRVCCAFLVLRFWSDDSSLMKILLLLSCGPSQQVIARWGLVSVVPSKCLWLIRSAKAKAVPCFSFRDFWWRKAGCASPIQMRTDVFIVPETYHSSEGWHHLWIVTFLFSRDKRKRIVWKAKEGKVWHLLTFHRLLYLASLSTT